MLGLFDLFCWLVLQVFEDCLTCFGEFNWSTGVLDGLLGLFGWSIMKAIWNANGRYGQPAVSSISGYVPEMDAGGARTLARVCQI
jgi:hypothetical protein